MQPIQRRLQAAVRIDFHANKQIHRVAYKSFLIKIAVQERCTNVDVPHTPAELHCQRRHQPSECEVCYWGIPCIVVSSFDLQVPSSHNTSLAANWKPGTVPLDF